MDDYNNMNFQKNGFNSSDAIKRHCSETHKSFFESKLIKSANDSGIGNVIEETLSKLHSKLKTEIVDGSSEITPVQSNLKKINKKIQLSMAEKESKQTLEVLRGNK
jgi:hypothetical protein